jgi:hypothetical protein
LKLSATASLLVPSTESVSPRRPASALRLTLSLIVSASALVGRLSEAAVLLIPVSSEMRSIAPVRAPPVVFVAAPWGSVVRDVSSVS